MAKIGRPTRLTHRIPAPSPTDPNRRLRVGDYIIELMEQDGTKAVACADQVQVSRQTIRTWLLEGQKASDKADQGKLLTVEEQHQLDFLVGTRAAHARWRHDRLLTHSQLAKGGLTTTEVIQEVDPTIEVTRPDGTKGPKVLKSRTKTTRLLPDPVELRWQLERLALDEDGNRMFAPRVEVTGADGGPIVTEDKDERAAALARELEAFQLGAEAERDLRKTNGAEA